MNRPFGRFFYAIVFPFVPLQHGKNYQENLGR